MSKLTLWHCADARSFRALWALEELGLDYELRVLPFPPRAFDKGYFEENPLGTVPLLVDGATRMTESAAIPHYLATVHGGGRLALGADHPEYGAYLNWLHHGEATLTFPQTIYLRYAKLEPEERRQPVVAEDYKKWFLGRLKLAEASLADGRDFLVGGAFTMADISVGYAIMLAQMIGIGPELPPHALGWFRRLKTRPGYLAAKEAQKAGPPLFQPSSPARE
ncbi:MAG: glutathione S-transferase family protein [Aquamicrobium sp.]|uniref:glutathione S-transferase family protein n=1 Tax=Aquamicrobium sp. TaxID=1872579 RepID=UPI00349EEF81|nr:glutathione S-transferase family protein [Aquamicrobium sp.]